MFSLWETPNIPLNALCLVPPHKGTKLRTPPETFYLTHASLPKLLTPLKYAMSVTLAIRPFDAHILRKAPDNPSLIKDHVHLVGKTEHSGNNSTPCTASTGLMLRIPQETFYPTHTSFDTWLKHSKLSVVNCPCASLMPIF